MLGVCSTSGGFEVDDLGVVSGVVTVLKESWAGDGRGPVGLGGNLSVSTEFALSNFVGGVTGRHNRWQVGESGPWDERRVDVGEPSAMSKRDWAGDQVGDICKRVVFWGEELAIRREGDFAEDIRPCTVTLVGEDDFCRRIARTLLGVVSSIDPFCPSFARSVVGLPSWSPTRGLGNLISASTALRAWAQALHSLPEVPRR